ncbi:MAG: hypothetical protein AAF483_28835, partial [Planctomycetota bacterium]
NEIKKFLEYPVQPKAIWQGGVFPFSELAERDIANSPMADAQVVLWVAREREVVHGNPEVEGTAFEALVSHLVKFIEVTDLGYRPEFLVVVNEELAKQLSELLAGSGTEVVWNSEPDFWCSVKENMKEHFAEIPSGYAEAPSLADSDCTESQIRAYAEAAAAFYRARPWQYLDGVDLLSISAPKPLQGLRYATVLGAGESEFGLGFYDSADTHWDLRAQRIDVEALHVFSLTFNPISEAVPGDVDLWQELELPLETGDAFPLFLLYAREESRGPTPEELEYVTILLEALASTTEEEIDSGEWTKEVELQDNSCPCTISIPDLLDPPDRAKWIERGFTPERRGNERHMRLVEDFMQDNQGKSVGELNALMTKFTGSIDDLAYPKSTPADLAENLCYAAIDTYGRRRVQLVRLALEADPTHVEATVMLAESTGDIEQKIQRFEDAVALGEKQCADFFESAVGHFWGLSETRPLMRAKQGLAYALSSDGQANAAIAQMKDLLRLNESDNQGVRFDIVPLLLTLDREEEAIEILERFPDGTGSWMYLKAQVAYRVGGAGSRSAQRAMLEAFRLNPHVVELLQSATPPILPDHHAFGSPEEAAILIEEQIESWMECDGFVEWMFARFNMWERESMKRERDKKRKALAKKKKRKSRK